MDNGASSYRRFLEGDDSGMVELVRDYKDGLHLYLNSLIHDLDAAEECVQDTFIKLAIKKPVFRGKSSFKTWLYTIGRNVAVSYLRKNARHSETLLEEYADIAAETDLERDYLREEQKITLHRAMHRLKQEHCQVLVLTYFEGFGNQDAAKIMGKSRKQVENLLYYAKKSLRSELEKEGFHYEEL